MSNPAKPPTVTLRVTEAEWFDVDGSPITEAEFLRRLDHGEAVRKQYLMTARRSTYVPVDTGWALHLLWLSIAVVVVVFAVVAFAAITALFNGGAS